MITEIRATYFSPRAFNRTKAVLEALGIVAASILLASPTKLLSLGFGFAMLALLPIQQRSLAKRRWNVLHNAPVSLRRERLIVAGTTLSNREVEGLALCAIDGRHHLLVTPVRSALSHLLIFERSEDARAAFRSLRDQTASRDCFRLPIEREPRIWPQILAATLFFAYGFAFLSTPGLGMAMIFFLFLASPLVLTVYCLFLAWITEVSTLRLGDGAVYVDAGWYTKADGLHVKRRSSAIVLRDAAGRRTTLVPVEPCADSNGTLLRLIGRIIKRARNPRPRSRRVERGPYR